LDTATIDGLIVAMTFYVDGTRHNTLGPTLQWRIDSGIVLVDGNRDYEYTLFDIPRRMLVPGGCIVVNNTCQAGPYHALTDFAAANPEMGCPAMAHMARDGRFPWRAIALDQPTELSVPRWPSTGCVQDLNLEG
jgi:hypothetical protein